MANLKRPKMSQLQSARAFRRILETTSDVRARINAFSSKVLVARGGRVGSGMGGLLEALWGYHTNLILSERIDSDYELAWFPEHQYNDFACVRVDADWIPASRQGELFRVEAKSMSTDADESKGHFDALEAELDTHDALLVLVWSWAALDGRRSYPEIKDIFFGSARPIARLRDRLHVARGGTSVDQSQCPDGCTPRDCIHHGEPLNEKGNRERLSGPETRRVSQRVSYAANFGGLVRMLKTNSESARSEFRKARREDTAADRYISFIHRHYPKEEQVQYLASEWREVAKSLALRDTPRRSLPLLCEEIRNHPQYMDVLRGLL